MTSLEALSLDGTAVTDAGLEHLKGLPKLQSLSLAALPISPAAEERLRAALPQLKIQGTPQRPDYPAPATAPPKTGAK